MNALPDKVPSLLSEKKTKSITNVSTVPKLSPFRYPGGKTWLIPEIRLWLERISYRPQIFIEPFAGGGIASLTAVFEDRVNTAILCELDFQVAALWQTILTDAQWLINQVLSFEINLENVRTLLNQNYTDCKEIALQTLVRNRTQRGGILAPGASLMKEGENGKGIASRWYPRTLATRIQRIAENSDRLRFVHDDGLKIVEEYRNNEAAVLFIDPPYTAGGKRAGKRLYTHNEIDHERLFDIMSQVRGKFLMTYDDTPEVVNMARKRGFSIDRVPMKNTHHIEMFELLITN